MGCLEGRVHYWSVADCCPPPMVPIPPLPLPEAYCQPKIRAKIMVMCPDGRWLLREIRTFNFPPAYRTRLEVGGEVYVVDNLYLVGSDSEGDEYEITVKPLSAYVTPICPPTPPDPLPLPIPGMGGDSSYGYGRCGCNPCGNRWGLPVYSAMGYPY
jgi:hypothetical protein